ncbi:amidohydrolase family protein [Patescibacteria group bacterium]
MYTNYHAHSSMMFWIGQGATGSGDWVKQWWDIYIDPIERKIKKDDIRILSEVCALAYLDVGITEVWDMYFFEDTLAQVFSKRGIKTYIGEAVMIDAPTGFVGAEALKETERLIEKYKNDPLIEPVVGYVGLYDWASNQEITEASAELAKKYKVPVHMHGAGNIGDFNDCLRAYKMMPIEALEYFGFFSEEIPEIIIAHCSVLDPKEIEILRKHKERVKVAICPKTNQTINYPLAPVEELIDNGIKVVLGTDGTSPCGLPDISEDIEIASKLYGVSREYFEKNNKSSVEVIEVQPKERKAIIKDWKALLDDLSVRARLDDETKREFLKSKELIKN